MSENNSKKGVVTHKAYTVYDVFADGETYHSRLPGRLLKDPMPEGPAKGHVVDLDPMLDVYYDYRGWDKKTAAPTPEKLKELGLEWVINS